MRSRKAARRLLPITMVMLGWLVLGLAAPLILNLRSVSFDLDHATVVAAPRHSFYVSEALAIAPGIGLAIERGRLGLDASDERATTGDARDRLLSEGTARLVAENATFQLFGEPPRASDTSQLGPLVAALSKHTFKSLAIRNARVRISAAAFSASDMTGVNAVLTPADGGIKLAGEGRWLDQPITFELRTRAAKAAAPQAVPVTFSFESPLFKAQFEGAAAKGEPAAVGLMLTGKSEVTIASLRRLVRELGGALADGSGFGQFHIAGGTALSSKGVQFESAKITIDDADASGAFGLSVVNGRTVISGTLDFETLDLGRYIAADPSPNPGLNYSRWVAAFADMMRTPLARMFDADLRISASELAVGKRDLGQSAATVVLRNGQLLAQVAEFSLDGGTGSGQLAIDFNDPTTPRINVRGKIDALDLGQLGVQLANAKLMEGRGSLTADLTARGTDLATLSSTLGGRVHVKLGEDGVMKFDAEQIRTLKREQKPVTATDALGASIPLEAFEAELVMHGGVLFCRNAVARGRKRQLTVTGQMRLVDGSMFLRVLDQPIEPSDAAKAPGAANAATQSATENNPEMMTLRGTLSQPRISVGPDDFNALGLGDTL